MKNKEIEELRRMIEFYKNFCDGDGTPNPIVTGTEIRAIEKLLSYIEQLENNRDKAIEILGNYKHYSTPTEEQNRENEKIVDNAYNILKGDNDEK